MNPITYLAKRSLDDDCMVFDTYDEQTVIAGVPLGFTTKQLINRGIGVPPPMTLIAQKKITCNEERKSRVEYDLKKLTCDDIVGFVTKIAFGTAYDLNTALKYDCYEKVLEYLEQIVQNVTNVVMMLGIKYRCRRLARY